MCVLWLFFLSFFSETTLFQCFQHLLSSTAPRCQHRQCSSHFLCSWSRWSPQTVSSGTKETICSYFDNEISFHSTISIQAKDIMCSSSSIITSISISCFILRIVNLFHIPLVIIIISIIIVVVSIIRISRILFILPCFFVAWSVYDFFGHFTSCEFQCYIILQSSKKISCFAFYTDIFLVFNSSQISSCSCSSLQCHGPIKWSKGDFRIPCPVCSRSCSIYCIFILQL